MEGERSFFTGTTFVLIGLVAVIVLAACMAGCPVYNVWSSSMSGQAQLAEANYSRQTLVAKARAELEAAQLYAEAEVARARGASQSAQIIGKGLENNPNYLQYLAIQSQKAMADSPNHTTVYIPTGNNGIPLVRTVNQPDDSGASRER